MSPPFSQIFNEPLSIHISGVLCTLTSLHWHMSVSISRTKSLFLTTFVHKPKLGESSDRSSKLGEWGEKEATHDNDNKYLSWDTGRQQDNDSWHMNCCEVHAEQFQTVGGNLTYRSRSPLVEPDRWDSHRSWGQGDFHCWTHLYMPRTERLAWLRDCWLILLRIACNLMWLSHFCVGEPV